MNRKFIACIIYVSFFVCFYGIYDIRVFIIRVLGPMIDPTMSPIKDPIMSPIIGPILGPTIGAKCQ